VVSVVVVISLFLSVLPINMTGHLDLLPMLPMRERVTA
jgi:hypothetical protein